MKDLVDLLKQNGFEVVEGAAAVKAAIETEANAEPMKLCSGYKIFPDGSKCPGCLDCSSRNYGRTK